jgi:hypothetical protein
VETTQVDDWVDDVALQPNGRIIAVGPTAGRRAETSVIARYLA